MKWIKCAKEGMVVACGQYHRNSLTQLSCPAGVIVDGLGNIYVTDCNNHQIMCWLAGSKEGSIAVGENGEGQQPNQFNCPSGLSVDRESNLYIADYNNYRVQKCDVH